MKSKTPVDRVTEFSAGGCTVQHVRVDTQEGFTLGWHGKPHFVALHDLHAKDCEIFAEDVPVARERDLRGRLAYIPSGCRSGGWMIPAASPQSFTALMLDPAGLEEELSLRLSKLPQRARVYFFDTSLVSTLGKLRACLTAGTAPDRVYAESLCMLAAMELGNLERFNDGTGMLFGPTMERVIEYIEQNLNRDISLEDLARVANLSRFHFLRAFKRSMRETPYQHLLRRRIERAQGLLRAGQLSIAEIATSVGFANPTRFTAAFRRITNSTPSLFRATTRR